MTPATTPNATTPNATTPHATTPSATPNTTKDEIIALEKEFWDAMKRKDGARASQLSGKTSLTTGARGVASISKEKMGEMTQEGNWTLDAYQFDDVQVITPAPMSLSSLTR